jgi:hypothetical protein
MMRGLFLRTSRRSSGSEANAHIFLSSFHLLGVSSLSSSGWSSVFPSFCQHFHLPITIFRAQPQLLQCQIFYCGPYILRYYFKITIVSYIVFKHDYEQSYNNRT